MKKLLFLAIIIMLAISMVAVADCSEATEVLIGSIWPMSGTNARFGEVSQNGVKLAVKHINESGGIASLNGATITLVTGDAQTDPSVTVAEFERIAGNYDISGFVGVQASSLTIAGSEITERFGIPIVTYSLADILVSRGFEYTFQIVPTATEWGNTPVDFVKEMLDEHQHPENPKIAILYEDSAYGSSTAKGIKSRLAGYGLDLVLEEGYPTGILDASSLIAKIKRSEANILFCCSYLTDAVLIQRALKENSVDAIVIGTGTGHSMTEFGEIMGSDAEYILVGEFTNYDLDIPGMSKMVAEYKDIYGLTMSPQAIGGYCLVWVLKEALEIAGSKDPKAVRDAIMKLDLKNRPATFMMGGRLKFLENGHNQYAVCGMLQWKDGELRSAWPYDTASIDLVWKIPSWDER